MNTGNENSQTTAVEAANTQSIALIQESYIQMVVAYRHVWMDCGIGQ